MTPENDTASRSQEPQELPREDTPQGEFPAADKRIQLLLESESYQPPRNGVLLLQVLVVMLFCVFVSRFWYLQVQHGQDYSRKAQENRLREERSLAPRGVITDSTGKLLADNRLAYGLALVREDCPDIPAALARISAWTGVPLERINAKYQQDRLKVKSFEPLLLVSDMPVELVPRIEAELINWPGLHVEVLSKRTYPEGQLFAHILGYVAEANEKELEADKSLSMGDRIGKQGLELVMEQRLRGVKGQYQVEVDALGRVLGRKRLQEPRGGELLRLSLDVRIQQAAWDALEGQAGCVVVMDPDTGRLHALVTSPSYDNNLFAEGISHRDWELLRNNKRYPLQNRVIQSSYPPGSVWKLMMAAMFLEEGISPDETVYCSGQVTLGPQTFRCWKKSGHGAMNMQSSIIHSCDVYYYRMAEKLGIDRIERFAKASGFGVTTGIDLPHERSGLVPSRAWKKQRFGHGWARGETLNVSIGQGYTLVTPLQMAVNVAAFLNGGRLLKPQLLADAAPEIRGIMPTSPRTREFILNAMRRTANGGTAKAIGRRDADMGGKTGTAQVVKLRMIRDRRLRTSEMAYNQRDHAWIASWGSKNGKRYVVIVMVEHGGGGGSTAGPVARKVYDALFSPELPAAPATVPAVRGETQSTP